MKWAPRLFSTLCLAHRLPPPSTHTHTPYTPTDNYYLLPFCRPDPEGRPRHKWGGLGEVLQGNELIDSQVGGRAWVGVGG